MAQLDWQIAGGRLGAAYNVETRKKEAAMAQFDSLFAAWSSLAEVYKKYNYGDEEMETFRQFFFSGANIVLGRIATAHKQGPEHVEKVINQFGQDLLLYLKQQKQKPQ